eukprot:6865589-Ditylum_brightwellii.AAC.1
MVNDGKGDKNLFSAVGTMMNNFTKSKSASRDEASYMLGGGLCKQMSMPVKKCSGNRLLWSDVVKQYMKHNSNDEEMN